VISPYYFMPATIHSKHSPRPNINGDQNYATADLGDSLPYHSLVAHMSSLLHEIFNVMSYKDGM